MKIPPISAYLEILSFSGFFPFFFFLYINELVIAWNVGNDWEIYSDLIRGYFENRAKRREIFIELASLPISPIENGIA